MSSQYSYNWDKLRIPKKFFSPRVRQQLTNVINGGNNVDKNVVNMVQDAFDQYANAKEDSDRANWLELEQYIQRMLPLPEITGTFHGAITTSQSPQGTFRRDVGFKEFQVTLRVAGSTTTTVIVKKNGTAVTGATISLTSTVTSGNIFLTDPVQFKKDVDLLNFEITAAGTGATDLWCQARGL